MCSSLPSAQAEGAAVDGSLLRVENAEARAWRTNPREHLIDAGERLDVGAKRAQKKKKKIKNKPEKPQRHPARQVQSCRRVWAAPCRLSNRSREGVTCKQQEKKPHQHLYLLKYLLEREMSQLRLPLPLTASRPSSRRRAP